MKKWMSRFAVLAVVGTLLASALVVGCGGGEEDTGDTAGTNAPTTGNTSSP